ncbi:MAG: tetratricopeptide repeat protein [Bacteroidales bacterium]|nr:tetratricopeptide repeat protein [Bacteroidales bacterium]MCF8391751.1 tetratricopeptide repeat protein [Bacteroidales bacterium]
MLRILRFSILFFLLLPIQLIGQEIRTSDSLLRVLENTPENLKTTKYYEWAIASARQRDLKQAVFYANKSAESALENQDYINSAKAYKLLADFFQRQDTEKSIEYYEKSLDQVRMSSDSIEMLLNLNYFAGKISTTNPNRSLQLATEALDIGLKLNNITELANSYSTIGLVNFYLGKYAEALKSWESALALQEKLGNQKEIGIMLTNIGVIYKNWGDFQKATEYYQKNLDIQVIQGDTLQIARALSNMGNIYFYVGVDYKKALDFYKQSLEYFTIGNWPVDKANTYNNIGLVYRELRDYGEALVNFRNALRIFETINYKPGIAASQNHMGNIYLEGGNYEDALKYSQNALKINREIGNRKEIASNLRDIGKVYSKMGKYSEALPYFNQCLKINQELGHKVEVFEIYKDISLVYEKQGKYQTALENFKYYNVLKDSTISEEYLQQISELEAKYETDRKEKELEIQRSQLAEKEAEALAQDAELLRAEAENRRQRVLLISAIFGLFVVVAFSILFYREYKEKQRANVLLEEQNLEIKHQRDQILQQKQEITDSILYASRIQTAILPPDKILKESIEDHFILYLPRDIVSGDYYWMTKLDNKTIVVAADCTGHGVPGAFLSMLGVSFLNEIVIKNEITQANEILNELRRSMVSSLHQTGEEGEAQDGMDISVIVINHAIQKLEYAGAYNPLYIVRKKQLIEYKADKMPIGIHFMKKEPFQNNIIDFFKDDCLYIFSDGYMDQFGGEKGKKFMARKFKDLILDIHQMNFKDQASALLKNFINWRGNIEQIDDVLVIGLKL